MPNRAQRTRQVFVRCGGASCRGRRLLSVGRIWSRRGGDRWYGEGLWYGEGVYLVDEGEPLSWLVRGTYEGRWLDDARGRAIGEVVGEDLSERWSVECKCGALHEGTTTQLVRAIVAAQRSGGGDVMLPLSTP